MLQFARCASTIDGNLSEGHALLGAICLMKKSYDEAVAHGTRAIEIEPNAADATALAMTFNWCGRASEAAELPRHAMRLNPIHSALMLRYDEAVDVYKQAIGLARNQIAQHLGLTICYAPSRAARARSHSWPRDLARVAEIRHGALRPLLDL